MKKYPMNLALEEVIKSDSGYVLRPFVELRGRKDGFKWKKGEQKGFWREFMDSETKNSTAAVAGLIKAR